MGPERLLVERASVEAVFRLLQVQEEVIVGHPVIPEQADLGISPEALDPVDRGRAADSTPPPGG